MLAPSVEDSTGMSRVRDRRRVALALVALIAIAVRVYPWIQAHTLLGVMEYDDGVYYGAARLLLHGALPYRDFTIVHPPVTAVLLLPFASVGAVFGDNVGMASARVAMVAVAMTNLFLVYRLALRLPARADRRRVAAVAAAALYAVMPDAVIAEQTVLLEPLVSLGCLLAISVLLKASPVTRTRAAVAGVLIAGAIGVKLFAGVYVVAVCLWLVLRRQPRLVLPFALGLAGGGVAFFLPFGLVAPKAFWHDVVVTQLSRPLDATANGASRVVGMTGLRLVPLAVGLLLLTLLAGSAFVWTRRQPASPLTLWLLVGVLGGVAFARSPSYFPHYGALLAPSMGMVGSRFAAGVSAHRWIARANGVALVGLLAAFGIGAVAADVRWRGQPDLQRAGRSVPAGSCVYYDTVSRAIAADVFITPSRRCPGWIDGRGVALTYNTNWPVGRSFYPAGFLADDRWQRETVGQLGQADWLLLRRTPGQLPEWSSPTRRYALQHFTPVWVGGSGTTRAELWRRVS